MGYGQSSHCPRRGKAHRSLMAHRYSKPMFPHGPSFPHRLLFPPDHCLLLHLPVHVGSQGLGDPPLRIFHHAVFKVWAWEEACQPPRLLEHRPGLGAAHMLGQPLEMEAEWAGKNGPAKMRQVQLRLLILGGARAASSERLVAQPVRYCGMRLPEGTQMGTPAQEAGVRAGTFRSAQGGTVPVHTLLKSSQLPRKIFQLEN